jgi:hypothetical protein
MLHTFDFCTSTWTWVATRERLGITQLEGVVVVENTLLVLGWSNAGPCKKELPMQLWSLDLTSTPGMVAGKWTQVMNVL